jgi:hypothetical protein
MMKFSVLHRLFLAAALLLVCQPAWAYKRVALVIGNAAYFNAPQLPNPVNDSAMIANTLVNAGFDVVDSRQDLSAVEMRRALRDFSDRARDADIAVIYYAGHGLELDGNNFLIPVDAKLERDADVYDEGLSLDRVLLAIEPAKQLRLVILDACRDNPFAKNMKKTLATRAIDRGLAKVEPTSPNTLIAYSAKAGSTALDGNSSNSPFTLALAKHLTTPGLDVRRAFGFVRDDVLKTTANRQEPFVYGSLGGEDVALVPGPAKAAPPAGPAPNPQAEARRDYELALQIGNKDALNVFLAQYPEGFYANLARLQLGKLQAEEAQVAATEKAQKAEQERARLAATAAPNAPQVQAAEADAKAAEKARLDAEKAKQLAASQAAEAEKKRVAMNDPANSARSNNAPAAINSPAPNSPGPMANSAPGSPAVVDPPAVQPPAQPGLVAALTPPPASNNQPAVAPATTGPAPAAETPKPTEMAALSQGPPAQNDLDKSVQLELRRVGCLNAPADGEWNADTKRSLSLFNRNAGTKLDLKVASTDTLDAIKSKEGRVCPVVCDHGFRASGDHCTRIVCAEGSFINGDNECEKRSGKTPTAKREIQHERDRESERHRDRDTERNRETSRDRRDYRDNRDRRENYRDERAVERPGPDYGARPPRVSSRGGGGTGQIVCGVIGCHAVARGCHIEFKTTAQGGPIEGGGGNVQVCN